MLVRIQSDRWLKIEQVSPPEEEIIDKHFTAYPKNVKYIDLSRQYWDGAIRKYDRTNKRLNRALLAELRLLCHKRGLPIAVIDERPPPAYPPPDVDSIQNDFLPGITLDDCQVEAIQSACRIEVGLFDLPTGGGKTELIAGICKAMKCPTAIIAEQTIVVEQIKQRLELRNVVEEVGVFCAGQTPNGHDVIVGTIQSLCIPSKFPDPPARTEKDTDKTWAKKLEKYESTKKGLQTRKKRAMVLRKMIERCDLLLVDEADRATSSQYRKLFLNWFKGRRKYGFSGTVFDVAKPVEKLILHEHLGSVIFRESRENLTAKGRIIPLEFYVLAVGNPNNKGEKSAFDIAVNDVMVDNDEFHQLVANLCGGLPKDEGTLVLVERDQLGHNLEALISGSRFIHGKTPKKVRREALSQFERREYNILIGGKILKRGLDLKGGCENLIIATGGQLQSEFIQQIGRAVRHNRKGKARVFDFLFLNNFYLYKHSRSRIKTMVDLGYPVQIIYDDGRMDGKKLVQSKFRRPKVLK